MITITEEEFISDKFDYYLDLVSERNEHIEIVTKSGNFYMVSVEWYERMNRFVHKEDLREISD